MKPSIERKVSEDYELILNKMKDIQLQLLQMETKRMSITNRVQKKIDELMEMVQTQRERENENKK